MKNIFLHLVIILIGNTSLLGQNQDFTRPQLSYQDSMYQHYMKKSKNNRTIGYIMLGTGAVLATWGGIVASENLFADENSGIFRFAIGSMAVIASIPILISAGNNKKQAKFFIRNETISHYKLPYLPEKIPAIGIRLDLGRKKQNQLLPK